MNQQNVTNLINYFKQNLHTPPQTLIDNCLKQGYPQEDINEAVKLLQNQTNPQSTTNGTSSPPGANQQATTSAAPSPTSKKGSSKLLIILLIIIVIVLGIGIGLFLELSGKNIPFPFIGSNNNPTPKINPKVIVPSPKQNISPSSSNTASFPKTTSNPNPFNTDPLSAFAGVFTSADYKIKTSGRVENKQTKKDTAGKEFSSSSAIDLNNAIIYTNKGKIARLDSVDPQRPFITFIKQSRLYTLNEEKKTYYVVGTDSETGKAFTALMTAGFPLTLLLEDHIKKPFIMEKSGESQWMTNWFYQNLLSPEEKLPVKIKFTIDPSADYLTTLSFQFGEDQPWQDLTFSYEKITSLETLLAIPEGYTEEKSPF